MRILSIGTDGKLFEAGSAVRVRQKAYAEKFGDLDIIVFSKRERQEIFDNSLRVVSTNSVSKLLYGFDAWRIARTLSKLDVITSQDPFETGLVSLFISRRLNVPLHVQVHTDFASNAFGFSSLHNHLRRHIAWFVLRRASHIRVVLQKTKDEIVARGIKVPVTVLPIYVDVGRFASISRTKHPRWKIAALCVGRLEKEKNFARAIDAVAAARKIGHDIGLTIIGSGSQLPRLRERAMRLGIVDRVEFAGWQNDLTKYYSQADIVLVPSRYEGYGLVIVEALAAGIPVLSTDVGVAREAGTILTTAKEFPHTLMNWIKDGPRQASLLNLPYRNFDEYVNRYCDDVAETVAN